MAYSPLGYSLPDLSVDGRANSVAAWGGTLSVTVDVYNRGASSIIEPLNLEQGATSSADAPPSIVTVFASTRPGGAGRIVALGNIAIPTIQQNSVDVETTSFALPSRPAGFPTVGGKIFLTFVVNNAGGVQEGNLGNNSFSSPQAVKIAPALPDLQLVSFQTPSPLQPGDILRPTIQVANVGTAAAGPFTVQLVASLDTSFGPGDSILATYTVSSLAPITATTASIGSLDPGINVLTLSSQAIALPSTPANYYLGVKIDAGALVPQSGRHGSAKFDAFVKVGPPIAGLPPTNYLTVSDSTASPVSTFPYPPGTVTTSGLDLTALATRVAANVASGAGTSIADAVAASTPRSINSGGNVSSIGTTSSTSRKISATVAGTGRSATTPLGTAASKFRTG